MKWWRHVVFASVLALSILVAVNMPWSTKHVVHLRRYSSPGAAPGATFESTVSLTANLTTIAANAVPIGVSILWLVTWMRNRRRSLEK